MAKFTEIDLSDDRLISIASDMVDNHKYIEALKMLNKNEGISGSDEDALMLYAEIYDDMGLYEKSVNGWFKYLDYAGAEDLSDCYEGLAVGFMNLGDEHFSAYYYNKLLLETDELDPVSREEIVKEFLSSNSDNPLKFVYPPELADFSEVFSEGVSLMKSGEYEKAIEEFDKVADGNPKYLSARNYVAMCKIIADRTEEAAEECLYILNRDPDNVQALSTLAAVRSEEGKREESVVLAKKLLKIDVTEPDEIYKIATVCCENKMHAEAYETFMRLPAEFDYDLNVLYFKAVSAFNCGKNEECLEAFDRLVTIYPDAVTARYYYNYVRGLTEKDERTELSYFYRLPAEVRESSLKILAAYVRLSRTAAKKLAREIDLTACIKWCFDEVEGGSGELQLLACHAAVKAELDELVRGFLLNAFLDDRIKIEILTALAERNAFDCFGVVICNVYRRITTQPLQTGRVKRSKFVRAYARLFAHFAILDSNYGASFADAAERLYDTLENENRLDCADDNDALCIAVYKYSGVNAAEINEEDLYGFFEASKERVNKILGLGD
ncbi:MAG: tetratricopeptide repeat protein [Clostridia bacterium]|nr:tetratricopeptide repeat protein [Clostridia bacterium]